MVTHSHLKLGQSGEAAVAHYLERDGFTILARNYSNSSGEIDLIGRKNSLIVFVEVKARHAEYFDSSELIVPSKQRKIIATAQRYLIQNKLIDVPCRFDVALVINNEINYIADAFSQADAVSKKRF